MEAPAKEWHQNVITPEVTRVLSELRRESILDGFYLAGGTGLALHLGHRRSVDLDLFNPSSFDENRLLRKVEGLTQVSVVRKESHTLHASIRGVKVSFLEYGYPMLFPTLSFLDVPIADSRDIACMKISAIMSRGKKRDFVDVYVVSQHFPLSLLLALFKEKFARSNYSFLHVLKSLTYFEDAENEPMPEMLAPLSWDEVKSFFRKEVLSMS